MNIIGHEEYSEYDMDTDLNVDNKPKQRKINMDIEVKGNDDYHVEINDNEVKDSKTLIKNALAAVQSIL